MTTNLAWHTKPVKVRGQRTRPALQLRGIIGIILGVILAIWLAGMAAGGIFATPETFLLPG